MADVNSMNYLVGLDFDLLKTNLNAIYSKGDGNGYKLLVSPTKLNAVNSATLEEMMKEFGDAFGINLDAVKSAMSGIGNIDLNKLSFSLTQAFMYMDTTAANQIKEYAFGIKVDATEALPSMGFFRIKSLSLGIWNTKRQTVLNQMLLGDFDKLLPA